MMFSFNITYNTLFQELFGTETSETFQVLDEISRRWEEPHRSYHSVDNHLIPLFQLINEKFHGPEPRKNILYMVALFHDIVYNPLKKDNEEKSAEVFVQMCKNPKHHTVQMIVDMILDTKHHGEKGFKPSSDLSAVFMSYDIWGLTHGTLSDLVKAEQGIFKEFQMYEFSTYKKGRIKFLTDFLTVGGPNMDLIWNFIQFIKTSKPRIGVYAGSFNPFHKGHYNILQKAEKIFDKVIIAVGNNPEKNIELCDYIDFQGRKATQRVIELQKILFPRQVDYFEGFLTDYLEEVSAETDVTLIRGLRNSTDFNYELTGHRFMEELRGGEVPTVWIPCDRNLDHISSSSLRYLEKVVEGSSKQYMWRKE